MCKPQSEGGQRCAAHTRRALAKARAALEKDPTAYEAVMAAEAEHASTPAGRKEIEAEYLAAESPVTRADLREALRRGDEIRERSQAVRSAVRTTPAAAEAPKETYLFVGHWEGSRIVVDYVMDGDAQDDREDDGEWPEGLWSAKGAGASLEAAQAAAVSEYEDPLIAPGYDPVYDPDFEFDLNAPDGAGNGPADMPIFSGRASEVADRLVPGVYDGVGHDGSEVKVVVREGGVVSVLASPEPVDYTRDYSLDRPTY